MFDIEVLSSLGLLVIELFDMWLIEFGMFDTEVFNCFVIFDMAVFDCSGIFDKAVFDCSGRLMVELFEIRSVFSFMVDLVSSNSDLVLVSDSELVKLIRVDPSPSFDSTSEKSNLIINSAAIKNIHSESTFNDLI